MESRAEVSARQLVQGVSGQFSLTVGEGWGIMGEVGVWGGRVVSPQVVVALGHMASVSSGG